MQTASELIPNQSKQERAPTEAPQAQPVDAILKKPEGASAAFQERLKGDKRFVQRLNEMMSDMAKVGEPIKDLLQAEVCMDLFGDLKTRISKGFEAINPMSASKNLRNAERSEIRRLRLHSFQKETDGVKDPEVAEEIRAAFERGLARVGLSFDSDSLDTLATDETLFQTFMKDAEASEAYEAVMHNRSLSQSDQQIEAYYRMSPSGERVPVLHVDRFAVNKETGSVVEFGFDVEKETLPDLRTGEMREQRIVKNPVIVMDEAARGSSSGLKFIVGLLPLVKQYKLDAAEMLANIKQGSYTWARIADVDPRAMMDQLPAATLQEIGPGPWDNKQLKGVVMRDVILPAFEQNMTQCIAQLAQQYKHDSQEYLDLYQELVTKQLNTEYPKLKERALRGEVSMAELANFGKSSSPFKFDKDGVITDQPSEITGHLGKAALLGPGQKGIPWKATIGLDRASLFKLVEGLSPGSGLMDKIKRAGMKAGIFAADLMSQVSEKL